MIRVRNTRLAVSGSIACIVLLGLSFSGCGPEPPTRSSDPYLPQTTEDNVLQNLQKTYRLKNVDQYASLLADDYHFFLDSVTAEKIAAPNWNRLDDSTATARLLLSEEVNEVRVLLTYSPVPESLFESGRARWTRITADGFLEVDMKPSPEHPEGMTLRVDHQLQVFYFRKGRSDADTLATSSTSRLTYIMEWWDQASQKYPDLEAATIEPTTEPTTWSAVKASFQVKGGVPPRAGFRKGP